MFYEPYYPRNCRNLLGKIADYSLVYPMKQKCINMYVPAMPLTLPEQLMNNKLMEGVPRGLPYGIRVRVWDIFFPNLPYTGVKVSYSIYTDTSGQAEELMFDYDAFDIKQVPWEDIIA